ncbi:MAG: DUF4136 domain-containing protein [Holophagae bacterium]|jgi:hypothetical protein
MKPGRSLALVAILALAGCAAAPAERPVRTEYSRNTAFQEWRTYRFASDGKGADYTRYPRYERMTLGALEEEMKARGYERIEDGTPDFRVAFDLIFRGGKAPESAPESAATEPGAQSFAGKGQTGSLIVRMLHAQTGEILWTGQVSEIKMKAIEPQKELRKAVWRVLVEFPPLTG